MRGRRAYLQPIAAEGNPGPGIGDDASRADLHARDFLFTTAESMALSQILFGAVGLLLSQTLPAFPLRAWIMLLLGSLVAGIFLESRLHVRRREMPPLARAAGLRAAGSRGKSIRSRRWLAPLPFIIFIPAFAGKFLSVRRLLTFHGFTHSAYVYQILHDLTPPENVFLPGHIANFYWYYHALIASISGATGTAPALTATVLALVNMLVIFALVTRLLRLLLPAAESPLVMIALALFAMFGMNSLGTAYALAGGGLAAGSLAPQALTGDPRLTNLFKFFLSFDGVATGLVCFTFVLLTATRLFRHRETALGVFLAALAVYAALGLHTTTGLFMIVAIPAAMALAWLAMAALDGHLLDAHRYWRQGREGLAARREEGAWTAVALFSLVVLAVPAYRFLFGSASTLPSGSLIGLVSQFHARSTFAMIFTLVPFLLVALRQAIRQRDRALLFLIALASVGLTLGYVARVSNNEYKFTFLASFVVTIVCALPLWTFLFGDGRTKRPARLLAAFLLAMTFTNVAAFGSHLLLAPEERENFTLAGLHVDAPAAYAGNPAPEPIPSWAAHETYPRSDLAYADVFHWVRESTAPDAILVVPLMHKDTSAVLLLSERLAYVVDGKLFTAAIPDYRQRAAQVQALYSPQSTAPARQAALAAIRATLPERPKYLLYPHDLPPLPVQCTGPPRFVGHTSTLYELGGE